ncbi:FUSC family protein [Agrobacterium pusense]|uniref:FUSC family protein n=1 Tax=Agrobacterium pusense TaxID=648995 RepID=UPI0022B8CF02|nr:FUSC family protein [Agrobacterium pusense]MCZ7926986.1 FUSC family protein [Agrobacterium pusense]MDP9772280.1 putative membrane protein YccC [Rhizobium sp. SORGH_AS_0755]
MSSRPVVTSGNVVFSLKSFLAAMLAYFVAISFDLNRPSWAVATVYIVAHPLSGAISSKSVYRLLGTVIGGGATILMVPNLVNEPILLSGAIIVWVSGCTFVSLLDRTPRSYVFLLAGYTVLLAGLPLVNAPANTFDIVVSRTEEIGLAIICASIVSHVVFPVHVGTALLDRIDGWMARAQKLFEATATGKMDETQNRMERHALAREAADLRSFAVHLQYDGSRYRSRVALVKSLQHRMVSFLPLLSELEDLRRSLGRLDPAGRYKALAIVAEADSRPGGSFSTIDALAFPASLPTWEKLLLVNFTRDLRTFSRLSDECLALRKSIEDENGARGARAPDRAPAPHRDIGMAWLSSVAVAVCLVTSLFFWIATGWSDGVTFAQISGVLCCLLATMDDPVPAMRKFVNVTIGAAIAAFVYGFAVLPVIDGFASLSAALGLFLIPAGICLAVPSLAIVGMGLCINFPLLLTLQAYPATDFGTFVNAAGATILAMVWTITVCGLFRSVRVETNARRLLSVVRKHVANIAVGKQTDILAAHYRMIDVAGLFASRLAKLPPVSEVGGYDPLRDIRAGLHLIAMQELLPKVSNGIHLAAQPVFQAVTILYRGRAGKGGEILESAVRALDDLILSPAAITVMDNELLLRAAALRLCIAPDADAPVPQIPGSWRKAA